MKFGVRKALQRGGIAYEAKKKMPLFNFKCRTILIISFFVYLSYTVFRNSLTFRRFKPVNKYVSDVRNANKKEMQTLEREKMLGKYQNYEYTTYESFIAFSRDVAKSYDAFFIENVQCVRDKGVSVESLKDIDFKVLPTDHYKVISPSTHINVAGMESDEERKKAIQRVDDALAMVHGSYHQEKKDETETGEFYDYATWGMQRWSGLQGYHYGIYDAECSCRDLPCAMANLFIHIIADFDGKGKRVLDSGCGWAPLGRLLTYKFDDLLYTGLTSSDKGVNVARNFTIDFKFHERSKIVKTNFIHRLPFSDNSFDAVFNVESLFHHPNHKMYLQEISRILDHGGEYRVMDYFIPTTLKNLKQDDQVLAKCVSDYWAFANFPEYPNFEQGAEDAGLIVKHRFDLYEKIRPFAVDSLMEDLQELERYISAVANQNYQLQGLFSKTAFDGNRNLRSIELQNLSEILGSKCNSILLANGVAHYTMYILQKP
jgi:ubiquinone/menaquinone biosynthesis C-methylase UbiE